LYQCANGKKREARWTFMETVTRYQEVFIPTLGSRIKIRFLEPGDMEALESANEREREEELVLQGIYDPAELLKKLCNSIGSDLLATMVSRDQGPFLEKLWRIKMDVLEAIYRVNELAHLSFLAQEQLDTSSGTCRVSLGPGGKLFVSGIGEN